MIRASLNSLDELDELEAREQQEKHKKETRREAQLLVSAGEISAPADTPQVYSPVDLSSPFNNPDFVASLANYNPSDLFWLDQGVGFGTPQTSQGS
jgi:hypothetical protein